MKRFTFSFSLALVLGIPLIALGMLYGWMEACFAGGRRSALEWIASHADDK